jgi:hypothetical protein
MEIGFRKSMPSGSTRGIMLRRKKLDPDPIQFDRITVKTLAVYDLAAQPERKTDSATMAGQSSLVVRL